MAFNVVTPDNLAYFKTKQDEYNLDTFAESFALKSHTHLPEEAGAAPLSHGHQIDDVGGLQEALDEKAITIHTHELADVIGLQGAINGKAEASHTHTMVNITDLQGALNEKAPLSHNHAITNDIYCNRLEPSGIITAKTALDKRSYAFSGESNRWADYTIDASHSHSSGGSDKAHNNMQPYTVINYIISTGETTNDVAAANITYPLAVSYGGTGSSSKTEALKNLGVTVSTSTAPATGSPMSVHIQILD